MEVPSKLTNTVSPGVVVSASPVSDVSPGMVVSASPVSDVSPGVVVSASPVSDVSPGVVVSASPVTVEPLVLTGVDIDSIHTDDATLLHWATLSGSREVVDSCLTAGDDVNATDIDDATPSHWAASFGYPDVLESLHSFGADVNTTDIDDATPLHWAVLKGHATTCEQLIAMGAAVNAVTSDGNDVEKRNIVRLYATYACGDTALHMAAMQGNTAIVDILVMHMAKINAKNSDGDTPLHKAAWQGHDAVVKRLLTLGAEVNARNQEDETPLHLATLGRHMRCLETLVAGGADVNIASSTNATPLHLAAMYGNDVMVERLVRLGSEVNITNENDLTTLHFSVYYGQCETVGGLVQLGANVNSSMRDGKTPLHVAANIGHEGAVKRLIEENAEVNAKTIDGDTPLHVAAHGRHLGVVEQLIEHGGDITVTNVHGRTPLHTAAKEHQRALVSIMLETQRSKRSSGNSTKPLVSSESVEPDSTTSPQGSPQQDNQSMEVDSHGSQIVVPTHGHNSEDAGEIERGHSTTGSYVDVEDEDGDTPLHMAIGDTETMLTLIANGASLNLRNKLGQTPLLSAIKSGQYPSAACLITHNADVTDAQRILNSAARLDDMDEIERLLEIGLSINARDDLRQTPLHAAAAAGCQRVVEFLIKHGANMTQDRHCKTPLNLAIAGKHIDTIIAFVKNGAPLPLKELLFLGARQGSVELVRSMLDRKAHVNMRGSNQMTPLYKAILGRHVHMAQLLIDNGANVNVRSKYNKTPLHVAATINTKLVTLLVKSGADINAVDSKGRRPIDLCKHMSMKKVLSESSEPPSSTAANASIESLIERYQVFDTDPLPPTEDGVESTSWLPYVPLDVLDFIFDYDGVDPSHSTGESQYLVSPLLRREDDRPTESMVDSIEPLIERYPVFDTDPLPPTEDGVESTSWLPDVPLDVLDFIFDYDGVDPSHLTGESQYLVSPLLKREDDRPTESMVDSIESLIERYQVFDTDPLPPTAYPQTMIADSTGQAMEIQDAAFDATESVSHEAEETNKLEIKFDALTMASGNRPKYFGMERSAESPSISPKGMDIYTNEAPACTTLATWDRGDKESLGVKKHQTEKPREVKTVSKLEGETNPHQRVSQDIKTLVKFERQQDSLCNENIKPVIKTERETMVEEQAFGEMMNTQQVETPIETEGDENIKPVIKKERETMVSTPSLQSSSSEAIGDDIFADLPQEYAAVFNDHEKRAIVNLWLSVSLEKVSKQETRDVGPNIQSAVSDAASEGSFMFHVTPQESDLTSRENLPMATGVYVPGGAISHPADIQCCIIQKENIEQYPLEECQVGPITFTPHGEQFHRPLAVLVALPEDIFSHDPQYDYIVHYSDNTTENTTDVTDDMDWQDVTSFQEQHVSGVVLPKYRMAFLLMSHFCKICISKRCNTVKTELFAHWDRGPSVRITCLMYLITSYDNHKEHYENEKESIKHQAHWTQHMSVPRTKKNNIEVTVNNSSTGWKLLSPKEQAIEHSILWDHSFPTKEFFFESKKTQSSFRCNFHAQHGSSPVDIIVKLSQPSGGQEVNTHDSVLTDREHDPNIDMQDAFEQKLIANRPQLTKKIIPDDLWDHLLSYRVITLQNKAKFIKDKVDQEQVGELLDHVGKRPFKDYVNFCRALIETNQAHVVKQWLWDKEWTTMIDIRHQANSLS